MSEVLFVYHFHDYTQRPVNTLKIPITAENWLPTMVELIRSGGIGHGPRITSDFIIEFCRDLFDEGSIGIPYNLSSFVLAYVTGLFPPGVYDWRTFEATFIEQLITQVVTTIGKVHTMMIEDLGYSICSSAEVFAKTNKRKALEIRDAQLPTEG